ncbi:MAG: hypothetical protein LBO66_06480 [Deltaproteobacteria bacterium]|jgi:hypothetical protein|nr:hypothetical protein [Deltaproteobacteria bacterium]
MKKIFALALGAMLAAMAVPAFAASPIEFEGYVKVFHESLSNFTRSDNAGFGGRNLGGQTGLDRDNFFENKLQISVTFRPNDQVSVFWQFRGPNYQRWGDSYGDQNTVNLYTRALYGEVVFPWGTIRGGRIVEGLAGTAGGLASLGYNPSWGSEFLYLNPFDGGDPVDSLTYTNKWDNGFGLAVYYVKQTSYWGWGSGNYPNVTPTPPLTAPSFNKDNDYDIFGIEGSYEWDGGGATLGVAYHRDMTDPAVESNYAIFINPSIAQAWGPFAIHFEANIAWGEQTESRLLANIAATDENKFKGTGLGLYLDGVYTYDSGDITLAAWFVDGTGYNADGTPERKSHDLVGLGDFAPFLVAFNRVTLGTGVFSNNFTNRSGLGGDPRFDSNDIDENLNNMWGIAFLGNHEITPDIKLNYGIGYFRLVEPGWKVDSASGGYYGRYEGKKDLGWEIDLGATFQILDNLSFETQFGYMFNGGAYDINVLGSGNGWNSAKDTFAWANVLAFTF